tara:strand:- start:98 stop:526 length:429 start_codon:yes stop_codon:yes gene_type:complete
MEIRNIWEDVKEPLERHADERGSIVDVFYKNHIEHVAVINSKPNTIRGNHYHKCSTQHILIISGSLEYWYKPVNSDEPSKMVVANAGDMISTPPNEIHAIVVKEDGNQSIVFSEGTRGGVDYESDTFRVESIILNKGKNGYK